MEAGLNDITTRNQAARPRLNKKGTARVGRATVGAVMVAPGRPFAPTVALSTMCHDSLEIPGARERLAWARARE